MLVWLSRQSPEHPQEMERTADAGSVSIKTPSNVPLEFTVTSDSDGHRLDQFLVSVLGGHSRSQIQKLIAAGHRHGRARGARAPT